MGEQLTLRGTLLGHGGWITSIATTAENAGMILTASRDKVLLRILNHVHQLILLVFNTTD